MWSKPEGYRLRDMTWVGKTALAVLAIGVALMWISPRTSWQMPLWPLMVIVLVALVTALMSEDRRLRREGRPRYPDR